MTTSASIDFQIKRDEQLFVLTIIQNLLLAGWSFDYEGRTFYLPIGDDDNFEWKSDNLSNQELIDVLREKERLDELIGVTMTWQDTSVGGEFLFYRDGLFSLNLSVNRRDLEIGVVDVNWYLVRIIPAIASSKLMLESIGFSEQF